MSQYHREHPESEPVHDAASGRRVELSQYFNEMRRNVAAAPDPKGRASTTPACYLCRQPHPDPTHDGFWLCDKCKEIGPSGRGVMGWNMNKNTPIPCDCSAPSMTVDMCNGGAECSADDEREAEYQKFVESMVPYCNCRDSPCDGVLAGGICESRPLPPHRGMDFAQTARFPEESSDGTGG